MPRSAERAKAIGRSLLDSLNNHLNSDLWAYEVDEKKRLLKELESFADRVKNNINSTGKMFKEDED
jgi:hypothetical protein